MARKSDLFLNFERMWREMDELMGEGWGERQLARAPRVGSAFTPRVDVFYSGRERPIAVVLVEIAGIDTESLNLEVSGRDLVISGERIVQQTDGRVYQQAEIEAGAFRRVIELGADVDAESAEASYDDGMLRVELPLEAPASTRVPIDPKPPEHAD
jgi:HSP20 family protein